MPFMTNGKRDYKKQLSTIPRNGDHCRPTSRTRGRKIRDQKRAYGRPIEWFWRQKHWPRPTFDAQRHEKRPGTQDRTP